MTAPRLQTEGVDGNAFAKIKERLLICQYKSRMPLAYTAE